MTRYNPSTLGIKHGSSQNIPSSYTGIFDNILVDLDPINKKISQLENSVEELRDDVKRDIGQVKKLVAKEAESAAKKAVQDYCDKKIGSVINDAVEGKIDKLIDEERLEVEKSLNYEFDELRDFVRLSMDKELKDFKCELKEVKANTLKATADNFYKSAETLSTIAADEVCPEPAFLL
ncbi:hypothetical protein [Wolbachia endosymbiont of Ctenocephalides felis wCfeT]|uniref:hypothetical protein n=1 Tax=Wolbachia endosymbiont of Ctenocephalides felis wCfeT TaxID=2732593 RepID=UPI00144503AA|nr:hypothetical protein [Wolbachia endosymbiont of Ctenocephalides felis wCfeT]